MDRWGGHRGPADAEHSWICLRRLGASAAISWWDATANRC